MVATTTASLGFCEFRAAAHPTKIRFAPNPTTLTAASIHDTPNVLQFHRLKRPDHLAGSQHYRSDVVGSVGLPGVCEALGWASVDVVLTGGTHGVGIWKLPAAGNVDAEEGGRVESVGGYAPFGKGVGVGALHIRGVEVAIAGDNGKIVIARINGQSVREIGRDTSQITALEWRGGNELVTASSSGQLTIYDIRQEAPGLRLSDQKNPPSFINCLTVHPTLHDKIATGDANGIVGIWDLRKMSEAAVERLNVHTSEVWDVKFHPDTPGKIVSCSEDGSICVARWSSEGIDLSHNWKSTSGLLRYQSSSHPLGYNSIDIHQETNLLVAAGDAGAIALQEL
ncbi:WD40-repeat-containing domain protein [Powellomyces hirtus]|nr:WD40-repeat-containing domain protein [Powellomyces hirtus]